MEFDLNDRVEQAICNFEKGYNCAQSVFLAYSDLFNLDIETAKSISVSFGGGLGRMRETCGVVSGMALLAGFKHPVKDPNNKEDRIKNYTTVQLMASLFKEKYGSIICRELLKAKKESSTPILSFRTADYYQKRPCCRFITDGAFIAGKMLKEELNKDSGQ